MASNRELFFKFKNETYLNEQIVYSLLIFANNFNNFTDLVVNFDNEIIDYNLFIKSINEIKDGKPLQYVMGYTFFDDIKIEVNENTLIPRPETEELCLLIKDIINENNFLPKSIGDICTGSGCISLFFKKHYKDSEVYAVDISKKALEVAEKNSENLRLKINFYEGNIVDPIIEKNIKFDVLISNPPYVENKEDIEEIVKNNEPINAIYSEDGTYFYEEIFKNHHIIMNSNRYLMGFEINYDQEEKLTLLINKYFNNENITYFFKKDSYNLTRFLIIKKGF